VYFLIYMIVDYKELKANRERASIPYNNLDMETTQNLFEAF